ncbi:hypothetical protein [Micromonospora sp. MA102]|uniref:hypothetical protein n=1 Tax=Micromonospora sp. MA102 TaxID=2952755 RepID=UPI0021C6578C|nr:hypothetical protein [Micromonospora sp. MA102]
MAEIAGDFEIHLTVAAADADRVAAFAARHRLGFVDIVLDRGRQPVQPMLSLRTRGTAAEALAVAGHWGRRLAAESTAVTRVKVEAAPWNAGVPEDDADAAEAPERYFEHHVKLLLPDATGPRLAAVAEVAARHGARLSHNARRRRPDGRQERFVTQRCHRVGRSRAAGHLDRLVADLRAAHHEIASVEAEYVVHDSCLPLDDGWL